MEEVALNHAVSSQYVPGIGRVTYAVYGKHVSVIIRQENDWQAKEIKMRVKREDEANVCSVSCDSFRTII